MKEYRFLRDVLWYLTVTGWSQIRVWIPEHHWLFSHPGRGGAIQGQGLQCARNYPSPAESAQRDESLHFAEAECFVRLEESILHLGKLLASGPSSQGCATNSVLQKEANIWCTWSSEYSTLTSILPPTQLPPRSNACTSGAWKTHPKIVWPQADKDRLRGSTSPLSLPTCPVFDFSGNGCLLARFISEKCFNSSI